MLYEVITRRARREARCLLQRQPGQLVLEEAVDDGQQEDAEDHPVDHEGREARAPQPRHHRQDRQERDHEGERRPQQRIEAERGVLGPVDLVSRKPASYNFV